MALLNQTPKRSCLTWKYEQEGDRYTGRIIIFSPLGSYVSRLIHLLLMRKKRETGKKIMEENEEIREISREMSKKIKIQRHTLNEVASRIWELADGTRTVEEIIRILAQETGEDLDEVEVQVGKFLDKCHGLFMINLEFPDPPFGGIENTFKKIGPILQQYTNIDIDKLMNL